MGLVFGRVAVDTQVRLCFGIGNSERTFIRRNFCGLSSTFYAAKPSPAKTPNPFPNL
jgi:hypothetical protein